MDEISEHIDELIIKYLDNSLSMIERNRLEKWKNASVLNQLLFEKLTDAKFINAELEKLYTYDEDKGWEKIRRTLVVKQEAIVKRMNWKRLVAAASVLLLISTAGYVIYKNSSGRQTVAVSPPQKVQHDVAPGGNKAILTLANGSSIILDSAMNGAIAQQGITKIIKLDSGQLAYNSEKSDVRSESVVQYNTVTTPRGGQYQIVLADGSKVWLNAASSLKYPTVFKGNERNVELTGEAYFEIAHIAAMPFHVKVNDMTVEVLGTHFNVMAYNDEASIKTTLLEGSVRVKAPSLSERAGGEVVIKPGQQAQLNKSGDLKLVKDADVDEAVAWKEGRFQFSSTNIIHRIAYLKLTYFH